MREKVRETIATKAWARWTVLAIVSFTMMAGYIVAKEMSPLQFMLEKATADGGMNWTSGEFGIFAGSRGFFNVFLLMLFVGGIILDKKGVRFTGILSCVLMLAGAAVVYGVITFTSPGPVWDVPLLGMVKRQVALASLGFAFFGIGYEMCGITVSKVVVRWFSGKEMALAMGLQVAMARLGTALALGFSPIIALKWGLSTPIMIGVFCVGVGLIAYLYYCTMDRQLDKVTGNLATQDENADDEQFHFSDMKLTVKNPGFWLITLLCLFYYSALYPFLDFATKLMISKYGVDAHIAGLIPAILPFTSIVLTPLFGAWCFAFLCDLLHDAREVCNRGIHAAEKSSQKDFSAGDLRNRLHLIGVAESAFHHAALDFQLLVGLRELCKFPGRSRGVFFGDRKCRRSFEEGRKPFISGSFHGEVDVGVLVNFVMNARVAKGLAKLGVFRDRKASGVYKDRCSTAIENIGNLVDDRLLLFDLCHFLPPVLFRRRKIKAPRRAGLQNKAD